MSKQHSSLKDEFCIISILNVIFKTSATGMILLGFIVFWILYPNVLLLLHLYHDRNDEITLAITANNTQLQHPKRQNTLTQ